MIAAAWWILLTHSSTADAFSTGIITPRSKAISISTATSTPALQLSATTTPTPMNDSSNGDEGGNAQIDGSSLESCASPSSVAVAAAVLADEPLINLNDRDEMLDMPWSDIQTWALMDNLPKFTVFIPSTTSSGETKKSNRYAMWRTVTREIPELAGYPIPFLRKIHQSALHQQRRRQQKSSNTNGSNGENEEVYETPGVLPMVDNFEFTANGGIIGRAYGLPGIADGTIIETPSLVSPERTVPLGYVMTRGDEEEDEDGNIKVGFSYELGTCATSTPIPSSSSYYSLDGTERSAALAAAARRLLSEDGGRAGAAAVGDMAKKMAVAGSGLLTDNDANQDLVYLGGATAMLLASATAVGMLSHHLTVNIFWV